MTAAGSSRSRAAAGASGASVRRPRSAWSRCSRARSSRSRSAAALPNCFVNSSICSPWAAGSRAASATQLSGKIRFERQHLKTPFCGWNFGTVRFYMISESVAVGSVNGNSLGKRQGGSKRRNEASELLRACKQAQQTLQSALEICTQQINLDVWY